MLHPPGQYMYMVVWLVNHRPVLSHQHSHRPREQQQYSKLDHTISMGNYESLNFNTTPTPDATAVHDEKPTHYTTGTYNTGSVCSL